MRTVIIESKGRMNWGKFMVGVFDGGDVGREQLVDPIREGASLLRQIGWDAHVHFWLLDLQTGEGAIFRHGGLARADLNNHRIWVCPLFQHMLEWLYKQPLAVVQTLDLPARVDFPDVAGDFQGYRRPGPGGDACGT